MVSNPEQESKPLYHPIPGEVVAIPTKRALDQFETDFVETYLPSIYSDSYTRWETRKPLSELVYPPGFHGQLVDISAVVMDNPRAQLVSVDKKHQSRRNPEWVAAHTIGFRVMANLTSTARPGQIVSAINSRVWVWQRQYIDHSTKGEYGRHVEKTNRTNDRVEDLLATSSAKGLELLREAVTHPYLGGFETRRGSSKGRK